MRYTAIDAWKFCAEVINGGGLCWEHPQTRLRVDEAIRKIAKRNPHAPGLIDEICMSVEPAGQCECPYVTLPREYAALLNVRRHGQRPFGMRETTWAYLQNGPWTDDANDTGDVHRLPGLWPIQREMDGVCTRLMAISDSPEEYGNSVILISGKDNYGRDILTGSSNQILGERMLIAGSGQAYYTQSYFQQITGVLKTPTKGYVYLYQWYDDTTRKLLARYHPDEGSESCTMGANQPGYARYGIPDGCECVRALARRAVIPLGHANDILPVQDLDAIKAEVRSLAAEGASDYQSAAILRNTADAEVTRAQEAQGDTPTRINFQRINSARNIGRMPQRFYGRRKSRF